MKIGILTFHRAENFGAFLQCYALQESIKKLNNEVEIIDYVSPQMEEGYKLVNFKRNKRRNPFFIIYNLIKEIYFLNRRILRHQKFNACIKGLLNISAEKKISEKYDAYVIGSDQIWNIRITDNDKTYFGYFNFPKKRKKYITYAASMPSSQLSLLSSSYFSGLDKISVRESLLVEPIEKLSKQKVYNVLDPTFLLSQEEWDKLIHKRYKKSSQKKYIIVYQVRRNKKVMKKAQEIAQKENLEIIEVLADFCYWGRSKKKIQTASPLDFLNLVKNAYCIITTSFHGTAFSIIFKKNFFYFRLNDGGDERVESLLAVLNLKEQIKELTDNIVMKAINYTPCYEILNNKIKESQAFIKESIVKQESI